MNKKRLNLIISVILGLAIFGFFLYKVGASSVIDILSKAKLRYFFAYLIITTLTYLPETYRLKIILRAYNKKVPFTILLRQAIAGSAVSYITPVARVGGEPLRVYMLNKEAGIDYRTGTSGVIMERFIDLTGAIIFGAIGLIMFFFIPGVGFWFKLVLSILTLFAFWLIITFYYRIITGKGFFSTMFNTLRLYKIKKFRNSIKFLEYIERRLESFLIEHKKEFYLGFFTYFIYTVLLILEMKFLLLALGINAGLVTIFLSVTVIGIVNFIPVPAALGFLEAGQTSLFYVLKGEGSIGFALSLLLRVRHLLFVALGLGLVSYFSVEEIRKKLKKHIKI